MERFTFGIPELYSGLEFLTVAVGTFAVGEVFKTILREGNEWRDCQNQSDIADETRYKGQRGTDCPWFVLGFFIGILPGAGATLASFFAYIVEKKISKNPESSVREPLQA